MKQTVRFGRISGFPVGVHWSVLIVVVLLAPGLAVARLVPTRTEAVRRCHG
jgi:hypothetical protein